MEIRMYNMKESMGGNYDKLPLIKTVDLEMYKDLEFGGFIVVDGQSYRHCMYNREKDVLCVEPADLDEDAEEIDYSSDFTCPYCGSVDHDAWELSGDSGETYCSSCGSELEYERTYTVEYTITPKKCAPVTKV